MALHTEAFALGAAPVPAVSRCARGENLFGRASGPRLAMPESSERGVPPVLAVAATALLTGVLAKRRTAETRAAAVALRAKVTLNEPLFSEEAWSDDVPSELRVQDLDVGQELMGIVVRVVDELGCFVDVGADRQGLVHRSKVSKSYVPVLSEVVQTGQTVKVWVRAVSPQGRLDLTMVDENAEDESLMPFKEVSADEWFEAEITGLSNAGAYVRVQPPGGGELVDGFIPISQIQEGFVEHPADVLEVGQTVQARVTDATSRLKLSMRKVFARLRLEDQDVSSLLDVSPDTWFTGTVDHAAPFGVFVKIPYPDKSGEGMGLVHISEMRDGRVGDPAAEVDEGQEVQVRVVQVDPGTKRISLSMKPMPEAY